MGTGEVAVRGASRKVQLRRTVPGMTRGAMRAARGPGRYPRVAWLASETTCVHQRLLSKPWNSAILSRDPG